MPAPEQNPFSKRPSKQGAIEATIRWLLRLSAYTVVIAAGFIFIDITFNGAKALLKAEAPFIRFEFLTSKPQTLHVFEPIQTAEQLYKNYAKQVSLRTRMENASARDKTALRIKLKELIQQQNEIEAVHRKSTLSYSDEDYRSLAQTPAPNDYNYNSYAYSGGGIGPAIIGTCILVVGSITIALILGTLCAIFLSEYSKSSRVLNIIRLSILNLAGVPSIVFGLFGFGMFVHFFGWGVSIIAGWFTLAIMVLPVIIAASEESLRSVPDGFREGSLALGASKWTTIRTNVLPHALPGILTSSIMGIARVAGETAPIMFTAAFALRDKLPWEGLETWTDFFFQGVMALPYHIYIVSQKIPQNEYTRNMQYGAAFIFMLIIGAFALSGILLRIKVRNHHKW